MDDQMRVIKKIDQIHVQSGDEGTGWDRIRRGFQIIDQVHVPSDEMKGTG